MFDAHALPGYVRREEPEREGTFPIMNSTQAVKEKFGVGNVDSELATAKARARKRKQDATATAAEVAGVTTADVRAALPVDAQGVAAFIRSAVIDTLKSKLARVQGELEPLEASHGALVDRVIALREAGEILTGMLAIEEGV